MDEGLAHFHPLLADWFRDRYGQPTEVQRISWPHIRSGEHVLITAPTGSGKTLTAFLWSLNQLIAADGPAGNTTILYVSPLKALNNDIQRNLKSPLRELQRHFQLHDHPFPEISVMTRSGDTPPDERRRMLRRPPDILITTPESLNLLISSHGGRSILGNLSTLILDEIHAVVASKRGTHLMGAVERLVTLSGEFQRIAISATVRPLDTIARFVGGFRLVSEEGGGAYEPRKVTVLQPGMTKTYDIRVIYPPESEQLTPDDSIWTPLTAYFKEAIQRNMATVLFVNSRRLCENITARINAGEERQLAYAHHGSLSRPIRETVEKKLKDGELRAIVATSSLEMGIDIGELDEVLLIQSPPSISSAIQRFGRAGHTVGRTSKGSIYPSHPRDIMDAAVLIQLIQTHEIEEIRPVEGPLDVLAQMIISMTGIQEWRLDALFRQIRCSYPYQRLDRSLFDRVVNMLAGTYGETRIRELKPRVSVDRIDGTIQARRGALRQLYLSGGTIPDRGYFKLRHFESGSRIGELDEEFVWENGEGSIFTLGNQSWRVERVTHSDVFVRPAPEGKPAPPFWKAEEYGRDFHYSERIGAFLETAESMLGNSGFAMWLTEEHQLDPVAAEKLSNFLVEQKNFTGNPLPHRHHLLIEFVHSGPGGTPGQQAFLHTFWGGRLNKPYAMAIQAAWESEFGHPIEAYPSDDCIVLVMAEPVATETLLGLVNSGNVLSLLRRQLEKTGFFGARFRECAGRALLLTRDHFNQRLPLWLSRLRSRKLLGAVMKYPDFPILLEAWRTCLEDEFDIQALKMVLDELESGQIEWSESNSAQASPFARHITWRQISQYMYMDDSPQTASVSNLSEELLRQVLFSADLRPTVEPAVIREFLEKRQRLFPGYAPIDAREIMDWIIERVAVPENEWEALLEAVQRDSGRETPELLEPLRSKVFRLQNSDSDGPLIVAAQMLPRILSALHGGAGTTIRDLDGRRAEQHSLLSPSEAESDPDGREELAEELIWQWLRYYGPLTSEFIIHTIGIGAGRMALILEDLIDSQKLINGMLVTGSTEIMVCDTENLQSLLRLARRRRRPRLEPLPLKDLQLFLAAWQGLTVPASAQEQLEGILGQLSCYAADAATWEGDILALRCRPYRTAWMDSIFASGAVQWLGHGKGKIMFCTGADRELLFDSELRATDPDEPVHSGEVAPALHGMTSIFRDDRARYDFSTLLQESGMNSKELSSLLWTGVWGGEFSNDTIAALRRGIETKFQAAGAAVSRQSGRRRPSRRGQFSRWQKSLPFAGNWYRLHQEPAEDLLAAEERIRDRVRLLLDRYGVLFRELLQREIEPFQWRAVFRALRLLELSGEILSGYFIEDVPGPQFASRSAVQTLAAGGLPENAIYYMSARDPASLCGIALEGLKSRFPRRLGTTYLTCHGKEVVVVAGRNGKTLEIRVGPDHPELRRYLYILQHLLTRPTLPLRSILLEKINGDPAGKSPYISILREMFDVDSDFRRVRLYRRP